MRTLYFITRILTDLNIEVSIIKKILIRNLLRRVMGGARTSEDVNG